MTWPVLPEFPLDAALLVEIPEKETLLRFGYVRPVSIQFFHVFDEEDATRMVLRMVFARYTARTVNVSCERLSVHKH